MAASIFSTRKMRIQSANHLHLLSALQNLMIHNWALLQLAGQVADLKYRAPSNQDRWAKRAHTESSPSVFATETTDS